MERIPAPPRFADAGVLDMAISLAVVGPKDLPGWFSTGSHAQFPMLRRWSVINALICSLHLAPPPPPPLPNRATSSPHLESPENPHPPPPPPLLAHLAVRMENFPVDPRPFVPDGFTLVAWEIVHAPSRLRSFLAFSLDKSNEDLAIATTMPPISKADFWPVARELRAFLQEQHVQDPEIQQCPMGEAYVRFDSPMQRESFVLGGPRLFRDYHINFIRHDKGVNMKDLDLDRSVWLMLLCFPANAKNLISLVDKSLASFGQLIHVHKSSTLARLIVRVLVNKDSDVPDSVTLSVGTYPRVRTWTVPVFLLCANDVVLGGDEDSVPVDGLTHGMPHPTPGWLGPVGPQPGGQVEDGASVADNLGGEDVDGPAFGMELNEEPLHVDADDAPVHDDILPDADAGAFSGAAADFQASDHNIHDLAIILVRSTEPVVSSVRFDSLPRSFIPSSIPANFSACLSSLYINLDCLVPFYISDQQSLFFLAKVAVDQDALPAPFGPVHPLVPYSNDEGMEDDSDVVVLPEPVVLPTSSKSWARKLKEALDDKFLRHSKRHAQGLQGFKDAASRDEASSFLGCYKGKASLRDQDVPAPHLPAPVIHGLATSFLQIQPSVVSAVILDEDDDHVKS